MLGQYNIAVGVSECRGMPPAIDKGFNLTKISLGLSVSHVTSASPVFVCLGLLQLLNNNVELVALSLESLKYKSDHCLLTLAGLFIIKTIQQGEQIIKELL